MAGQASATNDDDDDDHGVRLCHATGSEKNPYQSIAPASAGAAHGHVGHAGDIIPEFTYEGKKYSLNWTSANEAIWEDDCEVDDDDDGDEGGGGGESNVKVTAVAPKVDESDECEEEGDFRIYDTKGVIYYLDGKEIKPGKYDGPAEGTITAKAKDGYELANPSFSFKLDLEEAEECEEEDKEATAVAPKVDESDECDEEGDFRIYDTKGVIYYLDGKEIKPGKYDGPAEGTITAKAKDGYELTNPNFKFHLDLEEAEECDDEEEEVTAVNPTVKQSEECEEEGSFTIPDIEGVEYFLDGEEIEEGTYSGPISGTITAEADGDDFELTNEDFEFELDIEEAEECPVPKDECPNIEGTQTSVPGGYVKNGDDCEAPEIAGTEAPSPQPTVTVTKTPKKPHQPVAVPTAVNAGIGGGSGPAVGGALDAGVLAQALMGGGLLLLLTAGGLQVGRKPSGAHQI